MDGVKWKRAYKLQIYAIAYVLYHMYMEGCVHLQHKASCNNANINKE